MRRLIGQTVDIYEVDKVFTTLGFYSEINDSADRDAMIDMIISENKFYYTNTNDNQVCCLVTNICINEDDIDFKIIDIVEK